MQTHTHLAKKFPPTLSLNLPGFFSEEVFLNQTDKQAGHLRAGPADPWPGQPSAETAYGSGDALQWLLVFASADLVVGQTVLGLLQPEGLPVVSSGVGAGGRSCSSQA